MALTKDQRTELETKLRDAAKEIRRLADLNATDPEAWDAQCEERWDKANEDYSELKSRLERLQKASEAEEWFDASRDPEVRSQAARAWAAAGAEKRGEGETPRNLKELREQRELAEFRRSELQMVSLAGWCLAQSGHPPRDEHLEAAKELGIDLRAGEFSVELRRGNHRDLRRRLAYEERMTTSATAGGEFIPEGFVARLERGLLAYGGMRRFSEVIRTPTGNDLPWPYSNDTSNSGSLLAEAAEATALDVVTAALTLNAYKYTSRLVTVTTELLEDSAFDVGAILADMLAERIARATNTAYTTGDGSAKPRGITVGAAAGVTTAGAAAITTDEIIDLVHSVNPAYRSTPSTGFMMHDGIVKLIRKLKDTTNQYLWQPGLQLGVPDTLLGYPVVVNQDMDGAPTTGDITVLFGDLSAYKIRDVASFRLRRADERYVELDKVGFVAFLRTDGDLLDPGTNPVKKITQGP